MTWPAVVLWIALLAAAASSGPALLYIFMISLAFQTLQMLPGGLTGDLNILPQAVCAAFLVAKIALQKGNAAPLVASALDLRRVGLLTAFVAYSVPTAFLLPAFFSHRIEVVTLGAVRDLVHVSAGNFTQTTYITLSALLAAAFSIAGHSSEFRRHFLIALLIGGITAILTGLVDLATFTVGLQSVLAPFRTVTYTLLTDDQTLGSKRVVGLMSEASSYGGLCLFFLAALAFLRPCYPRRLRVWVVPLTILGLLVMTLLSTSSGAYLSLVVFVAAFSVNWMIRYGSLKAEARASLWPELILVLWAGVALLALLALTPDSFTPVYAMIDSTLITKSSTSSYLERSSWTESGWQAFWQSGSLGVGIGTLRTSNWFVNILGSTGLFGAALMFGFLILSFVWTEPMASASGREWRRSLKFILVPILTVDYFVGTTPDIGPVTAAILGLLASMRRAGEHEVPMAEVGRDDTALRNGERPALKARDLSTT